jgi:hypothetical protein
MPRRLADNSPAIYLPARDTCIVKRHGKDQCDVVLDTDRSKVATVASQELKSLPWKHRKEQGSFLHIERGRCTFFEKKRLYILNAHRLRKDGSIDGRRIRVVMRVNGIPRDQFR